jgi:hypothetical protein
VEGIDRSAFPLSWLWIVCVELPLLSLFLAIQISNSQVLSLKFAREKHLDRASGLVVDQLIACPT